MAQQANALSPFQAPVALYGSGASNPSLSISSFGKAYLAFTAIGSGGHDIRADYFSQGQWAAVTAPLDANVSDDAGAGSGRPQVATAGDGTAIVVWGESRTYLRSSRAGHRPQHRFPAARSGFL